MGCVSNRIWWCIVAVLGVRLNSAFQYAAYLHQEQRRKLTDTPYLAHLMAVSAMVIENGGDEDTAIAALLHDAIEDQGGDSTRQEILRYFGPRVVSIIDEVTETDKMPKPPWRERKETYLKHLGKASPEAALVALADKVHNAKSTLNDYFSIGNDVWLRFNAGKEEQQWWYYELVKTFKKIESLPNSLVNELDIVVRELFLKF